MMKKLTLAMLFLFVGIGMVLAQTRKVTGTVISAEDDAPIIGASVIVKGTTTGTVTDFDGVFTLEIPSSTKMLQFSYVGMVTREVPVQDVMKVVLNTAQTELDEVMVVAYGTAKKSSFTGSAKAVSSEDIVAGSKESLDKALSKASFISPTSIQPESVKTKSPINKTVHALFIRFFISINPPLK